MPVQSNSLFQTKIEIVDHKREDALVKREEKEEETKRNAFLRATNL